MIKLEKEELLKLAKLSALKLYDDEIELLVKQMKLVLAYTEELDQVTMSAEVNPTKNINVFREDKAIPTDSSPILKQAPNNEKTYFVVPKVFA